MKKSNSRLPEDRLSELPDSLIFHIFWLLPMRDVVRTTVLSKHWKNLWTTSPCLNFDFDDIGYESDDIDKIRNFVNRALILWEGINIQKFKIDFHFSVDGSFRDDFDFWLSFALRNKVQELYLRNPCDDHGSLPQNLYSCSSLKVLSLENCYFAFKGNVQWNQLKSLTIYRPYFMSEHLINEVVCGSPQLEVFILTLVDSYENLSIQSSSLKRLSIGYGEMEWDQSYFDLELSIWTPNLETLKILGIPPERCLLKDVSSLTHVNLDFVNIDHLSFSDDESDQIDPFGEILQQVFPTIQHVENVTLSQCCIKVLGDMINEGLIPSSSNAKFLELNNHYASCAKYKQIVGVLEIFPKLEMLVLKGFRFSEHVHESLMFDANLPKSFLLHLRTIDITTGERDNSVFPFMKIVLENASKLEKMVIRLLRPLPRSSDLFLTPQKLLSMQRSFPAVELMTFYED